MRKTWVQAHDSNSHTREPMPTGGTLSTNENPIDHDDPRLELLQSVYDRVNSWEETATPEQIRAELDTAVGHADIDVSDETRDVIAAHIQKRGGREDVADLL
jgi:hypothetical protein